MMRLFRTVLAVGCLGALVAGCAAPAPSQKIYNRYKALLASRNQMLAKQQPATTAPAPVAEKPAATAVPPAKPAPAPAPAKPVAPEAPRKPAVPAPAPAKPAPAPAQPAPPVQVVLPPTEPAAPPVQPAQPAQPAPLAPETRPSPVPETPAAPPPAPVTEEPKTEAGYVLKVGDGVQVYLRGIPTPEVIEDVIDEYGMITLPFINDIRAAGLPASELERSIRQTYLDQDIYRNVTVNVVVPTRFYFILGEVRGPGRFQIVSATRVSQAIAAAGGYTEFASGKVQVKRNGRIFKVIRNARRLERQPEDDILLEPDDVVEVLRSWI